MAAREKIVSIRFLESEVEQTDKLAEAIGKPRGTLIRELWLEFLKRQAEAS